MKSNTKQVVKKQMNIVDNVLIKVNTFQSEGELRLPKNYSPENALKSAYLILKETLDKDKKPVLESCTTESIANALLDMVVQGLSPMKKQCYFIAYGNKLQLSRSYQGTIAMAKRSGMKSIVTNVIYKGDSFNYEIDPDTGRKRILKHEQKINNIDNNNIIGAYAIVTLNDGTQNLEIMTIKQIRQAWMQGSMNGNSGAHKNFTEEMCKKTVINRACKPIINSGDDSYLPLANTQEIIEINDTPEDANTEILEIPDTNPQETIPEKAIETPETEKKEVIEQAIPVNQPDF